MPWFSSRAARTAALLAGLIILWPAAAKKKKKQEEVTQTLEILPDPPSAVAAETSRLTFHVSPLSAKGLLSQQVRDGIKMLWQMNQGANIVKLRALVAGTGDLRRVQSVVSESFTDKRKPLPALSVVQVGALPLEGAQVVLESVSVAKKPVNPNGLAFVSGQADSTGVDPKAPMLHVAPLAVRAISRIRTAVEGVGLASKDVLRVTCFLSSLEDINEVRRLVAMEFPRAASNYAQIQRAYSVGLAECEAVARMQSPPGAEVKLVNPPGLPASPNYSHVALVGAPRVVLTGTQLAFHEQDADVRRAFSLLKGSLEEAGGSMSSLVFSSFYPVSLGIAEKIRAIRFEFYDKASPPASTMLLFEGLPSLDASFGVDAVSVAARRPTSNGVRWVRR